MTDYVFNCKHCEEDQIIDLGDSLYINSKKHVIIGKSYEQDNQSYITIGTLSIIMTKKKLLVFEGASPTEIDKLIDQLNNKKNVIVTNLKPKVIILDV